MTRQEIEAALDAGRLEANVGSIRDPRWWKCRRNGKTKTWKKEPNRFRIPIKYGFRGYDAIDQGLLLRDDINDILRIMP